MGISKRSVLEAYKRPDLTNVLVHLTKATDELAAFDVLKQILTDGVVKASTLPYVTKYCGPRGAACFYDVPLSAIPQLVKTNPNKRSPYGIGYLKRAFWSLGGRPAIYAEYPNPEEWPENQRFRLINTHLKALKFDDDHMPIIAYEDIDWMHEREWRIAKGLRLYYPKEPFYGLWWMPLVLTIQDAKLLFDKFDFLEFIFVADKKEFIWYSDLE